MMKYIRFIWDKLTLTPMGFIPCLVYFVGWTVAKTIALIAPNTLSHYWAYVWDLPISTGKHSIFVFWAQRWVSSQFYQPLGYITVFIVVVVLVAKTLREARQSDKEYNQ